MIVCTYDEGRLHLLREALAAVDDQDPPCDEVVIVVDHNPGLAALLAAERPGDIVIPNAGRRGLSSARNTGVAVATGDVLVFLDDDAAPRPGWLAALTAPFADPTIAGVGGRAEPRWEAGDRPRWLPPELDWVVGCSYRGQQGGDVRNPIGASMALRAETLAQVGGFSTELGRVGTVPAGCEETEIGLRINHGGGRIVLADDSVVDHFVPAERARVRYVLARCYAEGASKAVVDRLARTRGWAGSVLGPEQRYAVTLAGAALRGILHAARGRSLVPAASLVLVPASLAAAVLGFLRGALPVRGRP